jgi:[ribosomal protein S18]-alanine N-acetyltransferase
LPDANSKITLTLRKLSAADADTLAGLHAKCFETGWSREDFCRFAEWPVYFGVTAWSGDIAAGFLILSVTGDEAEIISLCVDPGFRRRGVASMLLDWLLSEVANRGVGMVFLEVSVENAPARALYRHFGFEVSGRRPSYYRTAQGRHDALILKLTMLNSLRIRTV